MRYRDIIHKMERSGHYLEADNLRSSLSDAGLGDYDSVRSRDDARDGLPFASYDASCAERAYDDIRHDERREREQREQQEQQEH